MTKRRAGWVLTVAGVAALVLARTAHDHRTAAKARAHTQARALAQAQDQRQPSDQPAELPPPPLTPAEQAVFARLDPGSREAACAFFFNTPGPLDNYLLKLEGIVNVGNARFGEPDPENWRLALPVAKILEQGMCDCAQRNWLNQFIATGEAGLAGDLEAYHRCGQTMASIARHNGDPVIQ